ncbi:hypothetical protein NQ314_019926 [Rhamnusium bicolor]|uniref:PIR Superfamily Protein n=1 Tax=Rhamnusium bicolor TaxID=1586634 RepID=A0AAV8WPD2_9CUCU|nr:hypothetical protein NQ314_019926 [Rhamnusium bicolor]
MMVLLAFPFDYNQTDVDKTDEALQNFKDAILDPNFILMLNEFESKFLPINKHVEKRINDIYLYSSNRLREIEENSKDINADLDNCKENLNMPKVEEFYESYNEKCVKPISFLGKKYFFHRIRSTASCI